MIEISEMNNIGKNIEVTTGIFPLFPKELNIKFT